MGPYLFLCLLLHQNDLEKRINKKIYINKNSNKPGVVRHKFLLGIVLKHFGWVGSPEKLFSIQICIKPNLVLFHFEWVAPRNFLRSELTSAQSDDFFFGGGGQWPQATNQANSQYNRSACEATLLTIFKLNAVFQEMVAKNWDLLELVLSPNGKSVTDLYQSLSIVLPA